MSKKHFIAFAKEIKEMEDRDAAMLAAEMVCRVAAQNNVNFNKVIFMVACGF